MASGTIQEPYQKIKALWANDNPNSNFVAQTIPLDLSQYRFVLVRLLSGTSSTPDTSSNFEHIIRVGTTGVCYVVANVIRYRSAVVSTTGVAFTSAYNIATYGTPTQADNLCIPYQIYGIK